MKIKILNKDSIEINERIYKEDNFTSASLWKICAQQGLESKASTFRRMFSTETGTVDFGALGGLYDDLFGYKTTQPVNSIGMKVLKLPENVNLDHTLMSQEELEKHADVCFELGKKLFILEIKKFLEIE